MGREARRAYDLDQIEIVPSRRTRSSKAVSTAWQLDAYRFDIPLLTHPTDAVVSPDSALMSRTRCATRARSLIIRWISVSSASIRLRASASVRSSIVGGSASVTEKGRKV